VAVLSQQTAKSPHKADLSLSLAVADAMSAQTPEQAHRILSNLPIQITRSAGTDAVGGRFVTVSAYVRGTLTLRLTQRVGSGALEGTSSSAAMDADAHVKSHGGPFVAITCDEDPDDPCATQDDRDDALTAAAAMQSDLDAASAQQSADEADCYSLNLCWEENNDRATREEAVSMPATFAVADVLAMPAGSPTQSLSDAPAEAGINCFLAYTAAAGGILWAASGIALLAAAAGSPDPVSKLGLFGLWTNAAAGVEAAISGVGYAYQCWAQ
jgi:hypothetical protein